MEPESIAREFWFPVRERGAGLLDSRSPLVADGYGVYSLARRRYIRTTRHHRYRVLRADLAPLVKAYSSLQKLGMENWREYEEEAREITLWKRKLMDVYRHAAPDKSRASATERYLRVRYKHRMLYPFLACDVALIGVDLALRILVGRCMPFLRLLLDIFLIWFLLALTEILVTRRWILSRSVIYRILEFELTN